MGVICRSYDATAIQSMLERIAAVVRGTDGAVRVIAPILPQFVFGFLSPTRNTASKPPRPEGSALYVERFQIIDYSDQTIDGLNSIEWPDEIELDWGNLYDRSLSSLPSLAYETYVTMRAELQTIDSSVDRNRLGGYLAKIARQHPNEALRIAAIDLLGQTQLTFDEDLARWILTKTQVEAVAVSGIYAIAARRQTQWLDRIAMFAFSGEASTPVRIAAVRRNLRKTIIHAAF